MPKSASRKKISPPSMTTTETEEPGVPISTELAEESIHINQEYQDLIPPLSREEYKALKDSIKTEGQRIKIIVNQTGEIIDGHTRFKILKELGRDIQFEVWRFPNKEAERDFVIQSAILRRNLNSFQKIELAQHALELERKAAKERQKQGKRTDTLSPLGAKVGTSGTATKIVAKRYGIKPKTFERGQFVIDHKEFVSQAEMVGLREGLVAIRPVYDKLKQTLKQRNSDRLDPHPDHGTENFKSPSLDSRQQGVPSTTKGDREFAVDRSNASGESKQESAQLDRKEECQACGEISSRADLKHVLLGKECRRKLGMKW
jgi:hypothetical protein